MLLSNRRIWMRLSSSNLSREWDRFPPLRKRCRLGLPYLLFYKLPPLKVFYKTEHTEYTEEK